MNLVVWSNTEPSPCVGLGFVLLDALYPVWLAVFLRRWKAVARHDRVVALKILSA